MIIDCHVHVAAFTPQHGRSSDRLLGTVPFRFMRWCQGFTGRDDSTERQVEVRLVESLDATPELDKAVILAFDGVYDDDGNFDPARTHLHVTNDYVTELCRRHPRMLFGASVNPLRKDSLQELERCVAAGAVLLKWLPIVQGFSPADVRCIPFYEALAHYKLPLLSHTGGEKTLIRLNDEYAPPRLLEAALQRGVTVIAAHCGSRSTPFEADYIRQFQQMIRQYENLFGDTAALCLPTRGHAFDAIFNDPLMMSRLVHGSDWPVIPLPSIRHLGWKRARQLMREKNWLRRDVLIKQQLGFGADYWNRAERILRIQKQ